MEMTFYLDWEPLNPGTPFVTTPLYVNGGLAVVKVAEKKYEVCHIATGARTGARATNKHTARHYTDWMVSQCDWMFDKVDSKAGKQALEVRNVLKRHTETWSKIVKPATLKLISVPVKS